MCHSHSNVWLLWQPLDLNKKPLSLAYLIKDFVSFVHAPMVFLVTDVTIFLSWYTLNTSHEFTVEFKTWIWQGMSCPRLPKRFVLFRDWILRNEATERDAVNRNVWQIFSREWWFRLCKYLADVGTGKNLCSVYDDSIAWIIDWVECEALQMNCESNYSSCKVKDDLS